jgi:DNA-binding transcriptional LysR family regulator
MDRIENLRTFVTVAATGSLSAAARHLDIAASAVTKRIDQLESRMRTPLFQTQHQARDVDGVRRALPASGQATDPRLR